MDRALESSLATKQNVLGVLCADANGLLISGESPLRVAVLSLLAVGIYFYVDTQIFFLLQAYSFPRLKLLSTDLHRASLYNPEVTSVRVRFILNGYLTIQRYVSHS
jgi:hypothetical protein